MQSEESEIYRYRIEYEKFDKAIFLAHLDTADALMKVLRRSGLHYAITKGCHTRPKAVFCQPLPLGHTSKCEFFHIFLTQRAIPEKMTDMLNQLMPRGLKITGITEMLPNQKEHYTGRRLLYRIYPAITGSPAIKRILDFLKNPETEFAVFQDTIPKYYKISQSVNSIRTTEEEIIEIEFNQCQPGTTSVSKIFQGLMTHLGELCEHISAVERTAFLE